MGRGVSTLVLVLVLAGLGGYVYYLDSRPPDTADAKEKAFTVSADDIEELRIALTDGDTSTLRRVDNRWQLVSPVEADADTSEINNMASTLAQLEVQRVVEESAADLSVYGLATPRLEVAFRPKGQTTFERLLFGEKTPTGGDVYAKRPDAARVFLVSAFLEDTFRRTAFDLRDKTILRFDRDQVTGLEIVNASGTMQFERRGANWMFVQPRPMRADFAALEGTITSLSATLMQKFVAESATPDELAQYGLARPSARASILLGDSRVSLELGRTDNAETYAKDASKPTIMMVAPTVVGDINRAMHEFRRKEVFDLRSFSTTRLEVTRGGETLTLEKTTGEGGDVWKDGTGRVVETARVEQVLTQLANLRAQSFEDRANPALGSPAVVVTARFGENKDENLSETVRLASSGASVVASRPDEPGTLRIDGTGLEAILQGLDGLK